MPRPKLDPTAINKFELRITPPDAEPITDWKVNDKDFQLLLACREGGTEGVRLHYHVYLETLRSKSWILKWVYSIAHCYNGESGNSVVFTRTPHDNTIGYVVKHGDVACRHGCTDRFITEWLERSAQYAKDSATLRKQATRRNEKFSQLVRQTISKHLEEHPDMRYEEQVVGLILEQYSANDKLLPSRSVVENLTCTLLYPWKPDLIRVYYAKNLVLNREYNHALCS